MINYFNADADEYADEWELLERYDDMLDEVYGEAEIAGFEYATSRALRVIDPIAHRAGFNDWVDSEGWEESDDD